jgi:methylthioribose-1-phosphate isomerase
MAALAQNSDAASYDAFQKEFTAKADYLNTSRPTAVNLSWALQRMKTVCR